MDAHPRSSRLAALFLVCSMGCEQRADAPPAPSPAAPSPAAPSPSPAAPSTPGASEAGPPRPAPADAPAATATPSDRSEARSGGERRDSQLLLQHLGTTGDSSATLGALRDDSLSRELSQGMGGLVGAKGTGVGGGGTGLALSQGQSGYGSGTVSGLGGLGTRGAGRGAANVQGEQLRVVRGAPMTGDAYDAIDERPFEAVADAPLSTFSVDVDTASYSNVRRYLDDGEQPPASAVRIEELLNYFPYADAPPRDGAPFAAHTELTTCPWEPSHQLLRIGLQARRVDAAALPARNLVFLVDVSGSMASPDRLPLVVRGLDLLATQLTARDRVSLVVYAGAAGVVLPPTPGDRSGAIREALGRLQAGGSTAGGEGIQAAYALAKQHFDPRGINRVILATDGDFNVGVTSEGELVRMIEAERRSGVFLSVLGVGRGNLQDDRLEALADKGNGNYAYIDSFAEVRRVLGEQAGGTLVTVAKDVKVQVEMNPAKVSGYRLIGYENRTLAARDFNDDQKDAGEIGAGHHVTALYELVPAATAIAPLVDPLRYQAPLTGTAATASDEVLTVKLRYKEPDGDTSKLLSFPVRDEVSRFAAASDDARWAAAVAGFGMLLRDSPHRGTASWGWVVDTARESLGRDAGGYRAEMVRLVEKARALVREG